jgi:hypothetical protein
VNGGMFMVVVVDGGMHPSRYVGLSAAFKQHPGVRGVWYPAGLEHVVGLSDHQIAQLIGLPEVAPPRPKRRRKAA